MHHLVLLLHFVQTNSYQAAVLTDGDLSFVVFIYRCGHIDYTGGATIGFTAAHNLYANHPLSGTTNARRVACLNSPESEWTHLIYYLTENTIPTAELPSEPTEELPLGNILCILIGRGYDK